ncbi:filamentous hemagglutinin [Chitinophaga sp. CF418]|nr:filamentous hemagglutinin [Chitinophaga sp. CF418]
MKHFDEIMSAPGKFVPVRGDKGIHFLEKRLIDGRGIRLNLDGSFKGFI